MQHTRTHHLPARRPTIKLFRCTKHVTITTLNARRRIIRNRHDFISVMEVTVARQSRTRQENQTRVQIRENDSNVSQFRQPNMEPVLLLLPSPNQADAVSPV